MCSTQKKDRKRNPPLFEGPFIIEIYLHGGYHATTLTTTITPTITIVIKYDYNYIYITIAITIS